MAKERLTCIRISYCILYLVSDWWNPQQCDLARLVEIDSNSQIPDHLSGVEVDHVLINTQSALEQLLVHEVKGHFTLGRHVHSYVKLVGVARSEVVNYFLKPGRELTQLQQGTHSISKDNSTKGRYPAPGWI